MKQNLKDELEFRIARPDEWPQAIHCWHRVYLPAETVSDICNQLSVDSAFADGFWIARHQDRIVAATWVLPQKSNFAHCWPIRVSADLSDNQQHIFAKQLWNAILQAPENRNCRFYQLLLNESAVADRDHRIMQSLGFSFLTRIYRMRLKQFDVTNKYRHANLNFRLCSHSVDPFFSNVIRSTFENSLDVPELNALQTLGQEASAYEDERCERFLIEHQEMGVIGVVVLEQEAKMGLIRYIGLVPKARNQGIGCRCLRALLFQWSQRGVTTVELRVDERNTPAIRLYQRFGFSCFDNEMMLIYYSR